MYIEIKIENKELQNALNRLVGKTSDLKPLMRNLAGIFEDSVDKNFE